MNSVLKLLVKYICMPIIQTHFIYSFIFFPPLICSLIHSFNVGTVCRTPFLQAPFVGQAPGRHWGCEMYHILNLRTSPPSERERGGPAGTDLAEMMRLFRASPSSLVSRPTPVFCSHPRFAPLHPNTKPIALQIQDPLAEAPH